MHAYIYIYIYYNPTVPNPFTNTSTLHHLVLPQTRQPPMDSSAVIALGTLFALSFLLLVLTVVVVVLAVMLKRARTGSESICALYIHLQYYVYR